MCMVWVVRRGNAASPCYQRSHLAPQLLPRVNRIEILQILPQLADFQVAGFGNHNLDLDNLVTALALLGGGRDTLFAPAQLLAALRARRGAQRRPTSHGRPLEPT